MDFLQLLTDITKAYHDARYHKRNTVNQLEFELDLERNLYLLANEIWNRKYSLRPSICFIVDKPVKREIFAANFRDRVVHHYIINRLNSVFESQFVYDSYSCRVGKGTHLGIRRLSRFMRACSYNYTEQAYVLKLDISGFFMSINRSLLYEKVKRLVLSGYFVDDRDILLYLVDKIIFNNPTKGCIIKGRKSDWKGLPKNKSLFYAVDGCGLPIGNLTSQVFANVYMSEFDRWVKETLRVRYYGRYVDDFFLLHDDAKYLHSLVDVIRVYLKDNLRLTLHPKKIYLQPLSNGVMYLGVCVKPFHKTIANRTKGSFYITIEDCNGIICSSGGVISRERSELIQASVNSYLGIMCHYNTFRLVYKMVDLLDIRALQYLRIVRKGLNAN